MIFIYKPAQRSHDQRLGGVKLLAGFNPCVPQEQEEAVAVAAAACWGRTVGT